MSPRAGCQEASHKIFPETVSDRRTPPLIERQVAVLRKVRFVEDSLERNSRLLGAGSDNLFIDSFRGILRQLCLGGLPAAALPFLAGYGNHISLDFERS